MTFTPEAARAAVAKRWNKKPAAAPKSITPLRKAKAGDVSQPFDWQHAPLRDAEAALAALRISYEAAMRIVQERHATLLQTDIRCTVCGSPIADGQWKFRDDSRRDSKTGLLSPGFCCSTNCYTRYGVERSRLMVKHT